MVNVKFPYGKDFLEYDFDQKELLGVLESSIEEYKPLGTPKELVKAAMENPIGSPRLCELAKGKKKVVVVRKAEKIGRNDLCPCGSGKKYKKCCGANQNN